MGTGTVEVQLDEMKRKSRLMRKGHYFEDFDPGRIFEHHWGRTICENDNALFTTLTLHYNPLYFNLPYALSQGHSAVVVAPLLAFNVVFGLSVEDLSEGGGPFLGVDELLFHRAVHVGDTLSARSTVLDRRPSTSVDGFGIVTWHTQGTNQHCDLVLEFKRTNLIRRRPHA